LVYDSSRAGILSGDVPHSPANGWAFDLPYAFHDVIYVPGRGSYKLNGTTIEDNPREDMWFVNTGINFQSGTLWATSALLFSQNGITYYFHNEYIIAMTDMFGNAIYFEYYGGTPRSLYRISDQNGRDITINFDMNFNIPTIAITGPDGSIFTLTRNINWPAGMFALVNITNPVNATTWFSYNFTSAWIYGIFNNSMLLLSTVSYPSGALLNYWYSYHYDSYGQRDTWRVSNRFLQHNNLAYLATSFNYWGNIQPGATYSVTVGQNNGLNTYYLFNDKHTF
jgi:hypothetical protein